MAFFNVTPYDEVSTPVTNGLTYTFNNNTYQVIMCYVDEEYDENTHVVYLRNMGCTPPNDIIRVQINAYSYQYHEIHHGVHSEFATLSTKFADDQIGLEWDSNTNAPRVNNQVSKVASLLQVGDSFGKYTVRLIEPDLIVLQHFIQNITLYRMNELNKLPKEVKIEWRDE